MVVVGICALAGSLRRLRNLAHGTTQLLCMSRMAVATKKNQIVPILDAGLEVPEISAWTTSHERMFQLNI